MWIELLFLFHSIIAVDLGIAKYKPRSVSLNFDLKTAWKSRDLTIAATEPVRVPMWTGEIESEYASSKNISLGF